MSTTTRSTNGLLRVKEPLTYERRGPNSAHSYFQDRVLAEFRGNNDARARLERHGREMRVELPKLESRLPDGIDYETRANPGRPNNPSFAPPLWANEYFATAPRPRRVLASLIPSFDLPAGVGSVRLPRISEGTEAGSQADGAGVPMGVSFTTAAVESPSASIDGQSDWPMQSLEQSPGGAHLDFVILKDLGEAADAKLENYLFNGSGKGEQLTGILNLPTGSGLVSSVSFTGSHGYELETACGKAAGQLGDARECPPEAWFMRTARWAWLGVSEDTQDRPLVPPGHAPPAPASFELDAKTPSPVAPLLGWPVYCSDAIPKTLGTTTNQDAVLCIRPSDFMLFESASKTHIDAQTLSGTVGVRFQLWRYAAVLWRYPTAISTVTGSGLAAVSEY